MKVVVDFDKCKSAGICMRAAPEVFEVRDDGFLYVLDEQPSGARLAAAERAARGCPNKAITLVADDAQPEG